MHAEALAAEQDAFASLAATADPDLPVPSCPPWTVEALVRHTTGVHRWAAAAAGLAADADLPDDGPYERDARAEDYPQAAVALRRALADPARPCPTLAGPGTAAWWTRRQLHEVLVHHHDLAGALGQLLEVDPVVAGDCVAEVVDTMFPRQVRLGRTTVPQTAVELRAPSGTWRLGEGGVAAEVEGPEMSLALLLWRRTTLDDPRLTVTGDRPSVAAIFRRALTP
jgi:uncharacterized protein (TIGR03083 family)